jgi:Cu2+-containing amine oxidase
MVVVALVVFALPAGTAMAKTSKADKREAQKECRALRGDTDATREAFKAEWGNFGKCVSAKAHEAKAERKQARKNASQECREERAADADAFREKYGTNANKKNAFGKCVSQKAKAKRQEQDQEDAAEAEDQTNAAKECDAERSADPEAFAEKYGTNHNKKNAFGKCVSQKAHEDGEGT